MKFRTNRRHVPAPVPDESQFHPLFDMQSKRHFPWRPSSVMQWRPSLKKVPGPPLTSQHEISSLMKLVENVTIVKPKFERIQFVPSNKTLVRDASTTKSTHTTAADISTTSSQPSLSEVLAR